MLSTLKPVLIIALVTVTRFGCAQTAKTLPDEKICEVSSVSINNIYKEFDGQWQGITAASDGNCYFSSSTHSIARGAGFHKFNPETKEHTMLVEDMTLLCGEEGQGSQQGKIHSPIVEHKGWLYFSTHLSNYWKEGIENYPGAHLIGYEMATGKFRDFGIVLPKYSIYSAVNIDPIRDKIYVFVAPFREKDINTDGCHLYSVDIASGEKKDLGKLTDGQGGASFWFYVDDKGNCWFTLWKAHTKYQEDQGNLYCYRPDSGKIEIYKDVLPEGELINGTPVTDQKKIKESAWTWAKASPDRTKCYFTMGTSGGGDERLWIFDPSENIRSGKAFQDIAYIGSTFLQTDMGGDRLYFIQYADLDDERNKVAEIQRDKDPKIVGYGESLHLRSVSIDPKSDNKVVDHGKLVDQDGRAARFINSMAADDQGRVFMYGSWYIKSYKEATLQYQWAEHPNGRLFKMMDRGEFFAMAEGLVPQ
ncbi:hypothetical protein LCGC14_1783620 [marine sediment metagenome]|uniref:Uncharacterized protein n=1 Tax=marine sediment metagenome TaxID=412755 RepID=A0A0F9GUL1_9ZZZZ